MSVLKPMKCFRTPGKKGKLHPDPHDPPRCRANQQRGHGTYENDRPPIIGTVGRDSGKVRLRLIHHTDQKTLEAHVHKYTLASTQVYTDVWNGYNHIIRPHATVCHSKGEWARDDDGESFPRFIGDGIREVHVNTVEGMWTDVRNFLRPFKGVHKGYLSAYVAMAEFCRNLKRVSPAFISSIVKLHTFDR